jgi:xanthine dehydrogenase accessory factor
MQTVLVRGVNDIGSAIACRLAQDGRTVLIHDSPAPTVTRRCMAFADAIFDGEATLEDIRGIRIDAPDRSDLQVGSVVVTCSTFEHVLSSLSPDVLIDARMRKRETPEDIQEQAMLTIGLGPGFHAGTNCHIAIETSWEDLGRIIVDGPTLEFRGEPREIGGRQRERYVYAPVTGRFQTSMNIGDEVSEGDVVASIDDTPLHAPLSGILRGLTRDGVQVDERTKVIEVDPRSREVASISGIAERPERVADGVRRALAAWSDQ